MSAGTAETIRFLPAASGITSGLLAVSGALCEIELPAFQGRGRAAGDADPVTAGLAGRLAFDRLAWLEFGVGHYQGTIGKPCAPLGIDADLERCRVMPTGQFSKALQPDRVRARINDFAGVLRLACGKPMLHGLNTEIIDGIF